MVRKLFLYLDWQLTVMITDPYQILFNSNIEEGLPLVPVATDK